MVESAAKGNENSQPDFSESSPLPHLSPPQALPARLLPPRVTCQPALRTMQPALRTLQPAPANTAFYLKALSQALAAFLLLNK